jgi:molybdenum cofactor cytidylyltransferase
MIPGIVLAAGKSSRMGRPKSLLPVEPGGESFLDRITRVLLEAGVGEVIVVLGSEASAVRAAVPWEKTARTRLVENPDYEQGQLSSLVAGLRAADRPGVRAVLVTLVDVPLVSAATVRAVLHAYRVSEGAPIVRPARRGRFGHPVIFDRRLFEELRHADPAAGAKLVVRAHSAEAWGVEVPDPGAFISIETPQDYERYIGPFPGAPPKP